LNGWSRSAHVFDVGFSEMLVVAVVALIVIGPERLPRVARTMGHLFGRLQRYVNDVKADINREMELEELRKFKSTVEDAARGFESTVQGEVSKTETELEGLTKFEDAAATGAPKPASGDAPSTPHESDGAAQTEAPPRSEKTAA
jgi:sec-independent protein translocase protein TatB